MKKASPPSSLLRQVALAALLGGLSVAVPVLAQNMAPQGADAQDTAPVSQPHSSANADKMVEQRIKTLHSKLGITSSEETEWGAVAQTMRDNEATIHQLVMTRHQAPDSLSAIDDLQSYEDITQAHADGIKKLIAAFQPLYNDMSDNQKAVADDTFRGFEGHGHKAMKSHS